MSLSSRQSQEIEDILKNSLRRKMNNHRPEPGAMPFHTRLLGKDRMALFSFIHSLNTNFGTSIFEQVAIVTAVEKFSIAERQVIAGDNINEQA